MSWGNSAKGGSKSGGAKVQSRYTVTDTSYMDNTDGKGLTPEQYIEVREQRRQFVSDMHDRAMRMPVSEDENIRLSEDNLHRYYDILDGKTDGITRLQTKTLQTIRRKAQQEFIQEARRIDYAIDPQLDGAKTNQRSYTEGERWTDYVQALQRYDRAISTINSTIQRKADNYARRKRK